MKQLCEQKQSSMTYSYTSSDADLNFADLLARPPAKGLQNTQGVVKSHNRSRKFNMVNAHEGFSSHRLIMFVFCLVCPPAAAGTHFNAVLLQCRIRESVAP